MHDDALKSRFDALWVRETELVTLRVRTATGPRESLSVETRERLYGIDWELAAVAGERVELARRMRAEAASAPAG